MEVCFFLFFFFLIEREWNLFYSQSTFEVFSSTTLFSPLKSTNLYNTGGIYQIDSTQSVNSAPIRLISYLQSQRSSLKSCCEPFIDILCFVRLRQIIHDPANLLFLAGQSTMVFLDPGLLRAFNIGPYNVRAEGNGIKDLSMGGSTRDIGDSLNNCSRRFISRDFQIKRNRALL